MADCYTDLEKAVVVLVENFYKYVSKHSLVKNKISKSSFRKMLQKELNHMLTVSFLTGLLSPLLYPLGGRSLFSLPCPSGVPDPTQGLFLRPYQLALRGGCFPCG